MRCFKIEKRNPDKKVSHVRILQSSACLALKALSSAALQNWRNKTMSFR